MVILSRKVAFKETTAENGLKIYSLLTKSRHFRPQKYPILESHFTFPAFCMKYESENIVLIHNLHLTCVFRYVS